MELLQKLSTKLTLAMMILCVALAVAILYLTLGIVADHPLVQILCQTPFKGCPLRLNRPQNPNPKNCSASGGSISKGNAESHLWVVLPKRESHS